MSLTVYATVPDEKSAETLAKDIVVSELGACCNFWPVRTIYSWEGKLKLLDTFIDAAVNTLDKLPKSSSAIRIRNRCFITGRPRGVIRRFMLSRLSFREMALNGEIPGITKASW